MSEGLRAELARLQDKFELERRWRKEAEAKVEAGERGCMSPRLAAENERLRARIVELEREPTEAEIHACAAAYDSPDAYEFDQWHERCITDAIRAFIAGRVGDDGGGR